MLTEAMDLVVPIVPSSTRDRIGRCRNVPDSKSEEVQGTGLLGDVWLGGVAGFRRWWRPWVGFFRIRRGEQALEKVAGTGAVENRMMHSNDDAALTSSSYRNQCDVPQRSGGVKGLHHKSTTNCFEVGFGGTAFLQ